MIDRIFYTAAAVCAIIAVVIIAYEWFKEQQAPVDNVYPLHRRIL